MGIQQQIPLMLNQSTQMNALISTMHNLSVSILGQSRVLSNLQLSFTRLAEIMNLLHNSFVIFSQTLLSSKALGIGAATQKSTIKDMGFNVSQIKTIKEWMTTGNQGMVQTRGIVDAIKNGVLATRSEIKGTEIGTNKDPSVNMLKAGKAMTGIGAQLGAQIPQMMMMMFVMKPIMDLLQGVLSAFEPLLELFGVFGEIIGTAFTPLINQLMVMILPAIPFMVDLMQKLGPIIQLLWNFLTPLGLLIQFFSNFDLIIREFQKAFTEVGKAFVEVGKAFTDAGSFIMGILDAIGKGFSVVFGAIGDAFNNFVNWIKGIINTLLGWAFGGADKDIFTPG